MVVSSKKEIKKFWDEPIEALQEFVRANPDSLNVTDEYCEPVLEDIVRESLVERYCTFSNDGIRAFVELEIECNSEQKCAANLYKAFWRVCLMATRDERYVGAIKIANIFKDYTAAFCFDRVNAKGETILSEVTRENGYKVVNLLLEMGADPDKELGDGSKPSDHIFTLEMQEIYDRHRAKRSMAAQHNGFAAEGENLVSYTEKAPHSGVVLTTLFNFEYRTIKTLDGEGKTLLEKSFEHAVSQKQLNDAAACLEADGGNLHGWKPKVSAPIR